MADPLIVPDEQRFLHFLQSDEGLNAAAVVVRRGYLENLAKGRAICFPDTGHVIVSPEGPALSIDQVSPEARRSLPWIPKAAGKEHG